MRYATITVRAEFICQNNADFVVKRKCSLNRYCESLKSCNMLVRKSFRCVVFASLPSQYFRRSSKRRIITLDKCQWNNSRRFSSGFVKINSGGRKNRDGEERRVTRSGKEWNIFGIRAFMRRYTFCVRCQKIWILSRIIIETDLVPAKFHFAKMRQEKKRTCSSE